MALDDRPRNVCDGIITIRDDTPVTPKEIAVPFTGAFSYTPGGGNVVEYKDRGKHTDPPTLRIDEDNETPFSFEGALDDITDAAAGLLADILNQSGYFAASWVSTSVNSEVKLVEVEFRVNSPDAGGTDSTITFAHCYIRGSVSEGSPTQLSIEGTSHANLPTIADV